MGIKSQPVYRSLEWVPSAAAHVFVSAGEGALAVKRVFDGLAFGGVPVNVLHWDAPAAENRYGAVLENEFGVQVEIFANEASLMETLGAKLDDSPGGTWLYLAGPERFIWNAAAVARVAGMSREQWQTELLGSKSRRVYCVHCKALNEGVTQSIVTCSGCGLSLFVRDHYSRLMEAYVGCRVDAEEPGNVPKAEELYA